MLNMSDAPSYSKPPVSEALIDIRIDPVPSEFLRPLENLYDRLAKDYPDKKTRYQHTGGIKVDEGKVVSTSAAGGPIGYWFQSEDARRLIQVRLDGFTFNRLKPDPNERWPGWPIMREEAKSTWELYAQTLSLREITRLAIRYINQIVIPQPGVELNDYFTTSPQIPPGLPFQHIGHFFTRTEIPIPDLKVTAIVIQAPAREKFPDSVALTLDIDVFKNERFPANTSILWENLDRLRDLKNMIFEACLHQRAKELFI